MELGGSYTWAQALLGIYSVYSIAVVGKTISWKVATATYTAVVFLGVFAGFATRIFS